MSLRNNSVAAIQRARRLRSAMSESERRLWNRLRGAALGYRFRRQFPAGPYTLDFYCPVARLCIEVDGEQHAGLTLRVWSLEVFENLDGVVQAIFDRCVERAGPRPEEFGTETGGEASD